MATRSSTMDLLISLLEQQMPEEVKRLYVAEERQKARTAEAKRTSEPVTPKRLKPATPKPIKSAPKCDRNGTAINLPVRQSARLIERQKKATLEKLSNCRGWISQLRELPPPFVLGSFALMIITIVILAGFVVSLYSRVGELLLTFYILKSLLRWLRERCSD